MCSERTGRAPRRTGTTTELCPASVVARSASPTFCLTATATLFTAVALADARGTDGVLMRLADDDLAVVAAGEAVYETHCASCHGTNLEGQPNWRTRDANGLLPAPPHDASGHTWHHADDLLFEIVKYGPAHVIGDPAYRSAMPAYADVLDDESIVAVLSYIKSRWPDEQREWQEEIDRGQTGDIDEPADGGALLERLFK